MESTRMLTSTALVGGASGTVFDDGPNIRNIDEAAISKILLGHSNYIHSLTVHYGSEPATRHGSSGFTESEVVLAPGEFITAISGNYSGGPISGLRLETNKGKNWGPFGTYGESSHITAFVWNFPNKDMGLLYFEGREDNDYIWQLKATFVKFSLRHEPPPVVNYEEHVCDETDTQVPTILSAFTRNLMSPIVTLVVGMDGMEFRAWENIVCRLPFFRAAFQGAFREASEKKIVMPEDEPEIVSALIEFLYNGNYTYAYDPKKAILSDSTAGATRTPVGDLAEGSFHVRVYAIANKYSCQPLVKASIKSFICVLQQLKGIDVVRHWKTAYGDGLLLSDLEDDEGLTGFKKGLAKLLKDLYATHREEMDQTFAECPALGTDFLRVAVCSGSSA